MVSIFTFLYPFYLLSCLSQSVLWITRYQEDISEANGGIWLWMLPLLVALSMVFLDIIWSRQVDEMWVRGMWMFSLLIALPIRALYPTYQHWNSSNRGTHDLAFSLILSVIPIAWLVIKSIPSLNRWLNYRSLPAVSLPEGKELDDKSEEEEAAAAKRDSRKAATTIVTEISMILISLMDAYYGLSLLVALFCVMVLAFFPYNVRLQNRAIANSKYIIPVLWIVRILPEVVARMGQADQQIDRDIYLDVLGGFLMAWVVWHNVVSSLWKKNKNTNNDSMSGSNKEQLYLLVVLTASLIPRTLLSFSNHVSYPIHSISIFSFYFPLSGHIQHCLKIY